MVKSGERSAKLKYELAAMANIKIIKAVGLDDIVTEILTATDDNRIDEFTEII